MAATVQCASCKRLFAARMASCPFCGQYAPPANERTGAPDPSPGPPGAPPAPLPAVPPLPLPAMEPTGPSFRLPPVLVLAAAGVAVVAALVVRLLVPTSATGVLRWGWVISAPVGLAVLYFTWPDAARDAVRAWGGPFYRFTYRPSGDALQRLADTWPWLLSTAACQCVLYVVLTLAGAGVSAPAGGARARGRDPLRDLPLTAPVLAGFRRVPPQKMAILDPSLGPSEAFVDDSGRRLVRVRVTRSRASTRDAATGLADVRGARCDGDEQRMTCVNAQIVATCRASSGAGILCATVSLGGDEASAREVAIAATP